MLCLLFCSHRLGAHSVFLVVAAWGLVCVRLLLHCWSALGGWLSVLGLTFRGFLPLFALLLLFPLFRIFVTRMATKAKAIRNLILVNSIVAHACEIPYFAPPVDFNEAHACAQPVYNYDVFLGAGELLRRLVFSCVCAGLVPVAPAVGAVLAYLRLVHWWHAL